MVILAPFLVVVVVVVAVAIVATVAHGIIVIVEILFCYIPTYVFRWRIKVTQRRNKNNIHLVRHPCLDAIICR